MTTTSSTVELESVDYQHALPLKDVGGLASEGRRLGSHERPRDADMGVRDSLPAPTTSTPVVESWKYPRSNLFRVAATFWSFLVCGANDAAYGALIPYLESYYKLDYIIVSLLFLSPFVGYVLSAIFNNWLHIKFGQRGIAVLCGACHLVAYIIVSQHPPYPVLVVVYALAGFGNGIGDAAWNAFIGNLANANETLGFLHALYGVGGTISPLIATTMITEGGLEWYHFYYVMIGMSVVELVVCTAAFWKNTAASYHETTQTNNDDNTGLRAALFSRPYARVTWICAAFLLAYVGVEVSLGGWIVQFMIRVRNADRFPAGMTSVGFWLGLTVGRVVLGFVTPRLGVKVAVAVYLPATMALELVFWLVPQFYVSAVAIALQGFFLGPLFPAVIVAATKLLPRHLHVSTIGFAAAFGGSGAAVLPFAVGAIAQAKGVQVLQPIVLAMLVVLLGLWFCLPRFGSAKRD
ncbi:hypothetical protein VDGE_09630 [Verticillium dahliae]|uniref:Major facilitator superfamily (MFS) profile domain-containing protein n=1 Tax=Verticillium dahliae TaxID=27337 RepID=A0A444RJK5_VERDA|nr:hypothetical protein VDGE_09630 [Verticillium dahliae]